MKKITCVLAAAALIISLAACASNDSPKEETATSEPAQADRSYDSVFPQHEPYGKGIGYMPGRVVWSHDPDAVDWDGEGYWWQENNFDQGTIQRMVRDSIASLGNGKTARQGWENLFQAHNAARGKKDAGYKPGEKIAIKANMNGSGVFADDTSGETEMSYTNPVLLKMLLTSLVEDAGAAPSEITVYDVSRVFPEYMMRMCSSGSLSGVRFQYRDLTGENDAVADTSVPVVWSEDFSGDTNYLPTCVTEAEYLINLANLKGHSYGITLSAKNHFGSLMNSSRSRPPEAAGIHRFVSNPQMDSYTVLVDLLGSEQLGEKTVLYMLDGLICAVSEGSSISGENSRWQQAPFDGDHTSSILMSQDPVALDSVGADLLMNEPAVTERNGAIKDNPTVESYLHEAGLVVDPPSGTTYYNGSGEKVTNLGVHEHWNNSVDKQYSRNLGKEEGIELVRN